MTGAVLLRLSESHLKTHLQWTDFRDEVVAIYRAIAVAQTLPTPMNIGAVGKGKCGNGGKEAKGAGKRNNQTQQACSRCGNTDHQQLPLSDDLLQEAAGAPILVSKCNRDRWIGAAIVPTKGADEYAIAELKNDVSGSGFTEVLVRSDNGPDSWL